MKKLFAIFASSLIAFLLFLGQSWASTWYVSPSGGSYADENGTSYANAWDGFSNIVWGKTGVVAGDTLYVCGTHTTEYLTIGTSGNATSGYITIRGDYSGDAGIIDPNKVALYPWDYGLIEMPGKDYIHIISMTVRNGTKHGIRGSGCDYIIIEDCTVEFTDYGGINFARFGGTGGGSNITIDGCTVNHSNDAGHTSSYHECITLSNVDTFEIKNCTVYNGEAEGIDCKYGTQNGSVHHCTVYNNTSIGIYVDGGRNIDIYNNLIYGSHGNAHIAVWLEENLGGFDTGNINIYNNILRDAPQDGINLGYIESGTPEQYGLHDVTIINNTIENCTDHGIEFSYYCDGYGGGKIMYGTNIIRNNIFWENGGKDINDDTSGNAIISNSVVTIDYNLFKTGSSSDTKGSDYVETSDVKFVNQAGNDFQLQSDSPAIDQGSSSGAPSLDFDGNIRPFGNGYDMSAYEYCDNSSDDIPPTPPQGLIIASH